MTRSNSAVADLYARGETEGRSGNMIIEGDTVYSYGTHFPIAKHLKGKIYLFNSDSYSMSTSNHMNLVRRALLRNKAILIFIKNCDTDYALENMKYNKELLHKLHSKYANARSERKREEYKNAIRELEKQNKLLHNFVPDILAKKI